MGIKGLKKAIRPLNVIKPVELETLRGQMIGVDISLLIYQLVAVGNTISANLHVENNNHIEGLVQRVTMLLSHGITPVFFFDGQPPAEKNQTLEKRRLTGMKVDNKVFVEVTDILNLMGLELVRSPSEAEAQAARCVQDGSIYAVMSEDMDVLPLGAKMLIKDKNKYFTIDPDEVIEKLKFTREQFIDYCILLGCDYSSTLPKIGPVGAYKYISQYKTIENIIAANISTPDKNFDAEGSRRHFITPIVNPCKLVGRSPPSDALKERLEYYKVGVQKIRKLLDVLKT